MQAELEHKVAEQKKEISKKEKTVASLEAKVFVSQYPQVPPKSPIGKALAYTITYMCGLARYVINGKYKMDNNLIENNVSPVACRHKNFLFCGNHETAEDAAILYSMMGCCKAANVDFKVWMNYFLSHVHDYDTDCTKDQAIF